ncbi:hypothetical protein [Nostoc sp.]|uniref:hypothetical protein n=1 Tax=Nostoc sp. TaxID=1180 RepID=UPI002FF8154C
MHQLNIRKNGRQRGKHALQCSMALWALRARKLEAIACRCSKSLFQTAAFCHR